MIEPQQSGPCDKCNNLLEFAGTNRNPAYMREVGEQIHYAQRLETGMATSTSRFFQCPECGQPWQQIEDTGPDGESKRLHFLEILR